jgi:hypothetical protein
VAPDSCKEFPFRIEVPVEVFHKAGEAGKERRISGIISTEHQDQQGEIVIQRGLDFDPFLEHGWINDNHSRDTDGVVGYPLKVERTTHYGKPATRMEAYLLPPGDDPRHDKASKIWNLANQLQQTDRRLGYSIEGKVRRRTGRDGKVIAQALVRNVAITNCPVNTQTGLDLIAKSMMVLEQEDQCPGCTSDECVHKALAAGQAVNNPGAAPGEGFPLRTEQLEEEEKVVTYKVEDEEEDEEKRKRKKRRLTKGQARTLIRQRYPGAPRELADRLIQHAMKGAA